MPSRSRPPTTVGRRVVPRGMARRSVRRAALAARGVVSARRVGRSRLRRPRRRRNRRPRVRLGRRLRPGGLRRCPGDRVAPRRQPRRPGHTRSRHHLPHPDGLLRPRGGGGRRRGRFGPPAWTRSSGCSPARRGRRRRSLHVEVEGYSHDESLRAASNVTRPEFDEMVTHGREYVWAGDVFQTNLSQRLELAYPGSVVAAVRRAAHGQSVTVRGLPAALGVRVVLQLARAPGAPAGLHGRHPADRGHASPGPGLQRGRGSGRRPQPRSQGAGRAHHAGRSRAQRPRSGLRVRQRARRRADGERAVLPRDPHREQRHRYAGGRARRRRLAAVDVPRGNDHRVSEGPVHGDHRRARELPARGLHRLFRVSGVRRRHGYEHRHPHVGARRRPGVGAGGRRHRRRLGARARVPRVAEQGRSHGARRRVGGAAERGGVGGGAESSGGADASRGSALPDSPVGASS